MNRKGQESYSIVTAIPRIIFLAVALLSVVFLVRGYVVQNLNVQEVQAEVFINRILYSPTGILYFDESLKTAIPMLIYPEKLTNDTLDSMMLYRDDTFIAAKVELYDANKNLIKQAFYNGKTYFRWLPIARTGVKGTGRVNRITRLVNTNYFENGEVKPGIMNFVVLLPGR
jgi:hypothetical protein